MKKIFLAMMLATASMTSAVQAQITAPAVEERSETDPKYMKGAIPVEDGYAVIKRTIEVTNGATQDQLMPKLDAWIERCMNDKRISYNQRLESPAANQLYHMVAQEITFSKSFISHDFATISYVLTLDASEAGKVKMTMTRINFKYNEGSQTPTKYAAEELISDNIAFNKKGRIIYGYKKFRLKTIDLMDELAASLQKELR